MIDKVTIQVKAGNGGSGCVSGRREKFVPKGGPDGGNGGAGGSVHLVADANVGTLLAFRYRRRIVAPSGSDGRGRMVWGRDGGDVLVAVPVGTEVFTEGDDGVKLADLAALGQTVLVARGGCGGRGNASFTTSTNQFPLLAEEGEQGEQVTLRLELKLLADVGIVGAPNAGKSSLLAAATAARPKIGEYPFTTVEPVLGVVQRWDDSFVMADIPGLIEGAHKGAGLGHEFLQHVERTRVLVHVVDGTLEDVAEQVRQIDEELRLFDEALAVRPQIIVVNKLDISTVNGRRMSIERELSPYGRQICFLSAATGEGVEALMESIWAVLMAERQKISMGSRPSGAGDKAVIRPAVRKSRARVAVKRQKGAFVVTCAAAERLAPMVDQRNWNARTQFHRRLHELGVMRELEVAGVQPGDVVRIGKVEWEWQ